MKKIFLLSLLLISTASHGMEKETKSILGVMADMILGEESSSGEEKHLNPDLNSPIAKKIDKLEDALERHQYWRGALDNNLKYMVICRWPEHKYGYVENNGSGKYYNKPLADYDAETITEMKSVKDARYNNFSGMGALVLAVERNHTPKKDAKEIIRKLYSAGMEPTSQDQELAAYFSKSKLLNRD